MDRIISETLLSTIRVAFDLQKNNVFVDDEIFEKLLVVSKRQAVLPIVLYGLQKGNHFTFSDELKRIEAKNTYDYVQRKESLRQLYQVLDEEGIKYIPLKGAELCNLYPHPSLRTSSDIDILVNENDIELAKQTIEKKTSFRFYLKAHHDLQFVNERVHLELHFSLMTNINRLDNVLKESWYYSTESGYGARCVFTPEYQVFYITAHAAKHFIKEGGVGIRPLLDIWLLRNKTEYNEEIVRDLCNSAGILGFYEMCCNLLGVWFEGSRHSKETSDFEDLVMAGGVFGSERVKVLSYQRRGSNHNYIFKRVFCSSKDIKENYPVSGKYPVLVPLYQVVRWTHLLRSSKRKAVRAELRQAHSLDPAEVEKYDRLLKKMGL